MVKWISLLPSKQSFQVRILVGALAIKTVVVLLFRTARVWFNGRTSGCQSDDGSSILPTRTDESKKDRLRGGLSFGEEVQGMPTYPHRKRIRNCDFKTTLQVCTNLCILGIKDRGLLRESVK